MALYRSIRSRYERQVERQLENLLAVYHRGLQRLYEIQKIGTATICAALGRSFYLMETQKVYLSRMMILLFPIFCLSCLFILQASLLRSTVASLSSDVMQIHE